MKSSLRVLSGYPWRPPLRPPLHSDPLNSPVQVRSMRLGMEREEGWVWEGRTLYAPRPCWRVCSTCSQRRSYMYCVALWGLYFPENTRKYTVNIKENNYFVNHGIPFSTLFSWILQSSTEMRIPASLSWHYKIFLENLSNQRIFWKIHQIIDEKSRNWRGGGVSNSLKYLTSEYHIHVSHTGKQALNLSSATCQT